MEKSVDQPPSAWQPLTPRGVAAFARSSSGRILLVQLVTALLAAGAVAWFLGTDWFPTISAAIDRLPMQGAIQSGRLDWIGDSPQSLAESRFLAFAVDLKHEGQTRSPAHVQVEFGQDDVRVYSLFGRLEAHYPKTYFIAFNFQQLKPWWGAWEPMILAIAAGGVVAGLMIIWAVLATLYFFPAWLVGLYLNRELTLCGSWRLAGAALMPGALLMIAAIVLYGLGGMDVVRLIAIAGLQAVLGWFYLVLGSLSAPKLRTDVGIKANPFAPTALGIGPLADKPAKVEPQNPFRQRRD